MCLRVYALLTLAHGRIAAIFFFAEENTRQPASFENEWSYRDQLRMVHPMPDGSTQRAHVVDGTMRGWLENGRTPSGMPLRSVQSIQDGNRLLFVAESSVKLLEERFESLDTGQSVGPININTKLNDQKDNPNDYVPSRIACRAIGVSQPTLFRWLTDRDARKAYRLQGVRGPAERQTLRLISVTQPHPRTGSPGETLNPQAMIENRSPFPARRYREFHFGGFALVGLIVLDQFLSEFTLQLPQI